MRTLKDARVGIWFVAIGVAVGTLDRLGRVVERGGWSNLAWLIIYGLYTSYWFSLARRFHDLVRRARVTPPESR